jgi:flagellar basal body-associated protein FliL
MTNIEETPKKSNGGFIIIILLLLLGLGVLSFLFSKKKHSTEQLYQ